MLRLNHLGSALLAGTLILYVPTPARAQLFDLSEEQEIELGREAARKVDSEMPILNDPTVSGYVDQLGQKLARRSKRNHLKYRFKVVNSSEINAFALPGGFLYVNRGLLEAADNESEVAGVLGHEIGHVVGRHSADQIKKASLTSLGLGVLGAVLGNKGGLAGITRLGAELGANAAFMKFSRDDEREADRLGVRNMYDAGYHPDGMVTFFQKLDKLRKSQPGTLETFFSTHPSPSERVANVSGEIRSLSGTQSLRRDSAEFRQIKKRLSELPKPPERRRR
ncbi:MAG: M48 family metallopeptidase [Acidobacteriota bacterium]